MLARFGIYQAPGPRLSFQIWSIALSSGYLRLSHWFCRTTGYGWHAASSGTGITEWVLPLYSKQQVKNSRRADPTVAAYLI